MLFLKKVIPISKCVLRETLDPIHYNESVFIEDKIPSSNLIITSWMWSIPQGKETIERAVSECDGNEGRCLQYLLDRTYLAACTQTQQLQPRQPEQRWLQSHSPPLLPPFPPPPISRPLKSPRRQPQHSSVTNIKSIAAATKLRVEASNEAKKMRLCSLKMVKEMKMCPGAGENSRREGKACGLRMLYLHECAAASACVSSLMIIHCSHFHCKLQWQLQPTVTNNFEI